MFLDRDIHTAYIENIHTAHIDYPLPTNIFLTQKLLSEHIFQTKIHKPLTSSALSIERVYRDVRAEEEMERLLPKLHIKKLEKV